MAQFETWLRNDLLQIPEVKVLDGNFFSADQMANRIGVEVTSDGELTVLSGDVTGYVIRNDGATYYIPGELDGSRCWIDLPAVCYSVVGPISIVIKVGETTVGACTGYVYQSMTDEIVDPGHHIKSLEELLELIGDTTLAKEAALAAAENANQRVVELQAEIAGTIDDANDAVDQMRDDVDEAISRAEDATSAAEKVNIEMTKTDQVITFITTNRNNVQTTKTSQEPLLRVTKEGVRVTLTATDAQGTTTQSFTDAPIHDDAGLGDTEYLWSADKTQTELDLKLNNSQKGVANGLAELDASGKVPASQLPSFVDDVVESANIGAFPLTGETGKIYVALDTNLTYRWSGTAYVEISQSLAIGETSSTAFQGDKGKIAYDHAMAKGSAYGAGLYVIITNAEGHVTSARLATKEDIGLGNVDNTADVDKPASAATLAAEARAAASAETAQNAQYNAEAWAVGERNGTPVTEGDETYQNSAKDYAEAAEQARDTILNMSVSAETLDENDSATVTYDNGHMTFGIPAGHTGPAPVITSQQTWYKNSQDGTTIPSSGWSTTRPETPQGWFLWTRRTITWDNDLTTILYTVGYIGKDAATSFANLETRVDGLEDRVDDLEERFENFDPYTISYEPSTATLVVTTS